MFFRRSIINWRYAIGEVALITIGVLLAFAVDDWREDRAERKLEDEYLMRIESDLRTTLQTWRTHVQRLEGAIGLIRSARNGTLDQETAANGEDLWSAYNISHWSFFPSIPTTAFEELVSTGRLGIIEDVKVRDAISQFYSMYLTTQSWALDSASNDYSRLTGRVIPNETVYAADILDNYDSAAILSAMADLAADPDFAAFSNAQLNWHYGTIGTLQIFEGHVERLISQIEAASDVDQ